MSDTFNACVAARTRTAESIANNPELLALFVKHGGLSSDLQEIADAGHKAELLAQTRSGTVAQGVASTVDILRKFADIQSAYVGIMAVLQVCRLDLQRAGASTQVLAEIDQVLKDETAVVYRQLPGEDGKTKKVAVKSKAQERIRAEIHKDAASLLGMKEALNAMGARGVTQAQVEALRDNAAELAGLLANRSTAKGANETTTQQIAAAVRQQREMWSACYRILAIVGRLDERVRKLLSEASR